MSQLRVEGLDVYYGAVHALKGVSLRVALAQPRTASIRSARIFATRAWLSCA